MLGLGNSISASQFVDGGASFTDPTSLSGLQIWLKNDTGITTAASATATDGDLVYGWADASGNENDASASSQRFEFDAASGGIYSDPGLGNSILNVPQLTLGDFSIFMRVQFSSISSGATDMFVLDQDNSVNFFRIQNTTQIKAKLNTASATTWTTSTISTGTYYTLHATRTSDQTSVYINGVLQDSAKTTSTNNLLVDRIGSIFNGIIKNFVVYNRALTTAERGDVDTFMAGI